MASAIAVVVPGGNVKFDAPAGTAIALSNRDTGADLGRAKRYLGYQPEFKLHDALQDLGHRMKRYRA
jgi:nucleoside-diphosphate-sugar epimerase